MSNSDSYYKDSLYKSEKIEVRKSKIHGYGVFAVSDIKKGEVLEECTYLRFIQGIDKNFLSYAYSWPKRDRHDLQGHFKWAVVPFGYACLYNSSNDHTSNNADWETDEKTNLFIFKAVKDIPADTEILTYYGDAFWQNRKKN